MYTICAFPFLVFTPYGCLCATMLLSLQLTVLNNTGRQCTHHKLRQSLCAHRLVQTDNMWQCIYVTTPPSLLVLFNDRVIFKQYTPQKYSWG